tara:strand:- start:292 stop:1326 length:1035 start_codon:yes stop_codon:yes gene_type:complete
MLKTKNKINQIDKDTILSNMSEGVLAIDNNKRLLMINKTGEEYLDIKSNLIIGQTADVVISDKRFLKFIDDLLLSKKNLKEEIKIKKNMNRYFMANGTIIESEKSAFLIVISDITKLKQLEKIRQEFVANVSHELKTPITSIVGFLETLKQSNIPKAKQKEFLKKALKNSNRLNSIIDDLLWLSKIESMEDTEAFDLNNYKLLDIINSSIDDFQNHSNKKHKIEVDCKSSINIKADEHLIREAFINLLENAIKYGDSTKRIKVSAKTDDNVFITFHNYGGYIPDKYNEMIFNRFYRIDKSRSRRQGGTGLGLAIVKHIIFVHGGEIYVESKKNNGTSFIISLPG